MAIETKLEAQLLFTNGETKTIAISPFKPTSTAVTGFKARIMEINADAPGDIFEKMSLDGEPVQNIKAATITATESTVIYAKTESARIEALNAVREGESNGN